MTEDYDERMIREEMERYAALKKFREDCDAMFTALISFDNRISGNLRQIALESFCSQHRTNQTDIVRAIGRILSLAADPAVSCDARNEDMKDLAKRVLETHGNENGFNGLWRI